MNRKAPASCDRMTTCLNKHTKYADTRTHKRNETNLLVMTPPIPVRGITEKRLRRAQHRPPGQTTPFLQTLPRMPVPQRARGKIQDLVAVGRYLGEERRYVCNQRSQDYSVRQRPQEGGTIAVGGEGKVVGRVGGTRNLQAIVMRPLNWHPNQAGTEHVGFPLD